MLIVLIFFLYAIDSLSVQIGLNSSAFINATGKEKEIKIINSKANASDYNPDIIMLELISNNDDKRLRERLKTPKIIDSFEKMMEIRENYFKLIESAISEAKAANVQLAQPSSLEDIGFNLVSHGLENKNFRLLLAEYVQCSGLINEIPQINNAKMPINNGLIRGGNSNKIKPSIGFYSSFFFKHSIMKLIGEVILELGASNEVEVTLIFPDSMAHDSYTDKLLTNVDRYLKINTNDVHFAAMEIKKLNLSLLVFPEIGLNVFTYLLSFYRMAYKQAMYWGFAVTSGSPNMDYFISSKLFENESGQNNYSEKLYLMPSITSILKDHSDEDVESKTMSFFLDDGLTFNDKSTITYVIPTYIYKIHFKMDEAIKQIMELDVNGVVVLLKDEDETITNQVRERIRRKIPKKHWSRLIFINQISPQYFYEFIRLSDIILLPFPTISCITLSDVITQGKAMVILNGKGEYLPSCEVAFVDKLELDDKNCCIANSIEDYVQKAIKFGKDINYRRSIEENILRNKNILFNHQKEEVFNDWLNFFYNVTNNTDMMITD